MQLAPSTPIRSVDSTLVPLPPTAIWPVLADIGSYPQWWPKSHGVRIGRVTPELIGTELHLRPFGGKSFTCRVVAGEEPVRLVLEYSGFITGTAEWRLEPVGQGTKVTCTLDAAAWGRAVALLARVVDPARLHAHSMRTLFRHLHQRLFGRCPPFPR